MGIKANVIKQPSPNHRHSSTTIFNGPNLSPNQTWFFFHALFLWRFKRYMEKWKIAKEYRKERMNSKTLIITSSFPLAMVK
uniref:Uncharacterized protein n=1 Tax=Helianthus annuus TaxID=4232 RepID=A0A251VH46_HELAN